MTEASGVQRELPRYKSHKEVWALKIKKIVPAPENLGGAIITPEEPEYGDFHVDNAYMSKHQPYEGGYYVVYKDDYRSFSPAEAFEEGYTIISS